MRPLRYGILAAGLALVAAGSVQAQPYGYGMMGGYGPGYGMMGGYGPGYGMMGPGMMGYGGGYGPGWMMRGYGYGPGYHRSGAQGDQNLNLTTDDVKTRMERWLAARANPRLKLGEVKEKDADTITAEIVTKDNSVVERFIVDRHTGFTRRDNS